MPDESDAPPRSDGPAEPPSPPGDDPPGPKGDAGEEHYRRLIHLSPDLVLLVDEEGAVTFASLAAMDILRMKTPREVLGRRLEELLVDGKPGSGRAVAERLLSGSASIEETRVRRLDGATSFDAEILASPFLKDGRHLTHLVVRDVTQRKEDERARRRLKWRFAIAATLLLLTVGVSGSYRFYEYTESTRFCGTFCHSVMGPDLALHERSPHSHVSCAECHIGHGAAWYIKAKISGFRQVYAMASGRYSRPIAAPIVNLRPAMETCEECHSGRVFYANRDKVFLRYPDGAGPKDPSVTIVRLRVGGYLPDTERAVGIHWHAGHGALVEYLTDDPARFRIREVRVTERGTVRSFVRSDLPEVPAGTPWRTMDCTDCHNRVAHRYETPEEAVDRLILQGKLNAAVPGLKAAALRALGGSWATTKDAERGIRDSLERSYAALDPRPAGTDPASLAAEAKTLFDLAYRINVSPEMNVRWNNYADHSGHRNDLGCFRCHDDRHLSGEGAAISQACDGCHELLVDGAPFSTLQEELRGHALVR